MSSSANVRSFEALEALRSSLMRFKHEAQESMKAAAFEIERTRQWLQERLQAWQNELKRRKQRLEMAIAELRACEAMAIAAAAASGGYVAPDCGPQQVAVAYAKRRVQEAEDEIGVIQQHIKRVEEAIASYQSQVRRLETVLESDLLKGADLLSNSVNILTTYILQELSLSSASDIHAAISSLSSTQAGSSPTGLPTRRDNPAAQPMENTGPGGQPNRSGIETESSESSPGERKERYEGPPHGGSVEGG